MYGSKQPISSERFVYIAIFSGQPVDKCYIVSPATHSLCATARCYCMELATKF